MTKKFLVPIELPEVAATPTTPASGSAAVYAKTDGMPYWLGDDGVERAIISPVAPVVSLHNNPGFEGTWVNTSNGTPVVIGLTPPSWNTFWCQDQVTIQPETVQKTEGTYAVRMDRPVGTNKGVRLHHSTPFSGLNAGDVVTIECDAKSTVNGIFYVDVLFSDTQVGCDFFSGNPMTVAYNRPTTMTGGAAYQRCVGSFTVPTGCSWARVSFHYDTTGDVAGSIYIDNSSSRMTPAPSGTAPVIPPVTQMFTSNATWTKPSGCTRVEVEVVGGGGSGGGCSIANTGQHTKGSGGGGGGYAKKTIDASTLGATVAVTVGGGGAATQVNGNAGVGSSFGALVVAGGGGPGLYNTTNATAFGIMGGAGGTATVGDFLVPGGPGETAWGDTGLPMSGAGGTSVFGAGGQARATGAVAQPLAGDAGKGYGGGGSGAMSSGGAGSTAQFGGAGAPGVVTVTSYFDGGTALQATTVGARVSGSTTAMPTAQTTTLQFDTVDYNNGCSVTLNDPGASQGPGTSIIVPVDGTYQITANFTPDIQATVGRRVASVYSPALLLRTEWTQSVAATYPSMVLAGEAFLAAGTKVTCTFYHNSGVGPGNIMNSVPAFFSIRKVDAGVKGDPGPTGPAGGPSSVMYPIRQVFTTVGSAVWTKPQKFVYAEVEVQGGGGAGGGVSNSTATTADAGASGGGGGYTKKIWLDAQLTATETVVVGAGGTAGAANDAAAAAGTASSFKTTQIGNGGGGAGAATGNAGLARSVGGSGGGGSGGDYTITGGDGPNGSVVANAGGTAPSVEAVSGGTSFMAGASRPAQSAGGGGGANGQVYGGGGSGGYSRAASGGFAGGAGAAGIVIVTSYVTT